MNYSRDLYFTNKKIIVSFFLSILVFFIHFKSFSVFNNIGSGLSVVFDAIFSMTYIAVPLFFIISGSLFYRNYNLKSTFSKWKSRFFSLCVPYLFWNTFWLLLALAGHYTPLGSLLGGVKTEFSVEAVLGGVFLHKFFTPFWFMLRLIIYTGLCPVIYLLLKNKLIGILTIITAFVLKCLSAEFKNLAIFNGESLMFYLIGAWIGIHCFEVFKARGKKYAAMCIIIYFLCCIIMGLQKSMPEWFSVFGVDTVVKLISCAALWISFDVFNMEYCPHFMNYSFLIYALHSFVGTSSAKIIFLLLSSNPACLPLVAVVSFLFTISIICVFGFLIEKYLPKANKILAGR